MTLRKWKTENKRGYEDLLLLEHWREVGGLILTEVTVGRGGTIRWPEGAKLRRIDAVRVSPAARTHLGDDIVTFDKKSSSHNLRDIVASENVEVIEIKRTLNRVVLGQVIVGADLFELEYSPATINQTVVCGAGDPVLEWVCNKRDITVWKPPVRY